MNSVLFIELISIEINQMIMGELQHPLSLRPMSIRDYFHDTGVPNREALTHSDYKLLKLVHL